MALALDFSVSKPSIPRQAHAPDQHIGVMNLSVHPTRLKPQKCEAFKKDAYI